MDKIVKEALEGVADLPDMKNDNAQDGPMSTKDLLKALWGGAKTVTVKCGCCGKTLSLDVLSDSDVALAAAALMEGWMCCPSPEARAGDTFWCPDCEEEQTLAKLMGLEDYDGSIAKVVMMELDSFGMEAACKMMELMLEKLDEAQVCKWLDKKDTRITLKTALGMRRLYAEDEMCMVICEGTLMRLLGRVAGDALIDMAEDAVEKEE